MFCQSFVLPVIECCLTRAMANILKLIVFFIFFRGCLCVSTLVCKLTRKVRELSFFCRLFCVHPELTSLTIDFIVDASWMVGLFLFNVLLVFVVMHFVLSAITFQID